MMEISRECGRSSGRLGGLYRAMGEAEAVGYRRAVLSAHTCAFTHYII